MLNAGDMHERPGFTSTEKSSQSSWWLRLGVVQLALCRFNKFKCLPVAALIGSFLTPCFVLHCISVKALAMCGVELCPASRNVAAKKTGILPYYTSRFPVNRLHRGFLILSISVLLRSEKYMPTLRCRRDFKPAGKRSGVKWRLGCTE